MSEPSESKKKVSPIGDSGGRERQSGFQVLQGSAMSESQKKTEDRMIDKVEIRCTAAVAIKLEDLTPLQGNLKELSETNFDKLKKSILKHGITFPFFVWQDGGKNWILDGTQRDRVLRKMAEDGYQVPPLPSAVIEGKNKQEACEKILLISSGYGKMTPDSLYQFVSENDLGFLELEPLLELPAIDLEEFKEGYFDEPKYGPASAEEQSRLDQKKPFQCPKCGHEFTV